MRGNSHKLQHGKFQVDIWKEKKNHHLHAQALEQVAQRDLGICILGGVQSLTEYCPKEPGLITVLVLQLGLDDIGTAAGTSGPFQTKLLYKFESTKMEQVGQKPYPPYGGAVFYHSNTRKGPALL